MVRAIEVARESGASNPAAARRLALALSRPFAVEAYRQLRMNAYVGLAHATKDAKLCVDALDAVSPISMDHTLYQARALCYRAANDPRLASAEEELGWLLSFSRPFGADIKVPPPSNVPSPRAAPAEDIPADAGGAGRASLPADAASD